MFFDSTLHNTLRGSNCSVSPPDSRLGRLEAKSKSLTDNRDICDQDVDHVKYV